MEKELQVESYIQINLDNSPWSLDYGDLIQINENCYTYACQHRAGFFSCCTTILEGLIHHTLKGKLIVKIEKGDKGLNRYCAGAENIDWNSFFDGNSGCYFTYN